MNGWVKCRKIIDFWLIHTCIYFCVWSKKLFCFILTMYVCVLPLSIFGILSYSTIFSALWKLEGPAQYLSSSTLLDPVTTGTTVAFSIHFFSSSSFSPWFFSSFSRSSLKTLASLRISMSVVTYHYCYMSGWLDHLHQLRTHLPF